MSSLPVALVTGGGRGIGRCICRELAGAGFYVIINYLSNKPEALSTLNFVEKDGGQGRILQFDVTDRDQTSTRIKNLLAEFEHIEVLVNNAGVTADGLLALMPPEEWDRIVDTSLGGFYNVTQPLLTHMIANRKGYIVNIASVAALVGNRGQANYSAAKAGLIGATRSLAAEVGRLGIKVNAVAPGMIESEMTEHLPLDRIKQMIPMGRAGRPEEVAKVVRFLCSSDASYITGQVISVNGGML